MLWYDRRLIDGGTRLDFDSIRHTTLRPFGMIFMGSAEPGQTVEVRLGFSLRGCEQARQNLERECGRDQSAFDAVRTGTRARWRRTHRPGPGRGRHPGPAHGAGHRALPLADQAVLRPTTRARSGRPSGPYAFDICTMWDIYKTQLPLLAAIAPERAADLLESLIRVCEEEGNFPIGYRMARGADRFFRQASALAHTALADAYALGRPGLDWSWALVHMVDDLRRMYGEDFFEHGVVHPITHTLDLAYAHHCTAQVARALNDQPPRRRPGDAQPAAGSTPSTRPPACCATPSSTRAASGTTRSGCCTTWPPGSPWPAATTRSSACSTSFFGYGADAGHPARPRPRRRPRWPPGTP